jgi:hypothetical protein
MKLTLEILDRFFYAETGRVEPLPVFEEEDEPEAEEVAEVIRLPFGFLPPPKEEVYDDGADEEEECG